MKRILLLFIGLLLVGGALSAQDVFAPMRDALKTGNAREVVKFFNASVDMTIEGSVDSYSSAQAEFVLRDFFKKHPPSDFVIKHTGASKGNAGASKSGSQFAIGRYTSNNDSYTVLILVKDSGGTLLIHEINFVKE